MEQPKEFVESELKYMQASDCKHSDLQKYYLRFKHFWMHTMYQMYSKHQSVSLSRKNKQALSSNGERCDEQVLCSPFTLNSDLQTYSYTSDCSALLRVLILCSVLLDSCKMVTYFQREITKMKSLTY